MREEKELRLFPVLSKLQETLIVGAVLALVIYFFAIKPHYDLKEAKATIEQKDKKITVIHHDSDKEVFTTKHTEIKKILQEQKKATHEKDINLSVGDHILILP